MNAVVPQLIIILQDLYSDNSLCSAIMAESTVTIHFNAGGIRGPCLLELKMSLSSV